MSLLDALGLRRPAKLAAVAAPDATLAGAGGDAGPTARADAEDRNDPKPGAKGGASDAERAAFAVEYANAQSLLDALRGHASAARISVRLQGAQKFLDQAKQLAAKGSYDAAMRFVADAVKVVAQSQGLADDWTAYIRKRTDAKALIESLRGLDDDAVKAQEAQLAAAEAKVQVAKPDFAAANTLLDGIRSALGTSIKTGWVDDNRKDVTALRAMSAQAFGDADLKKIEEAQAKSESEFAAGRWSQAILAARLVARLVPPARKMLERRAAFDLQRKPADDALQALRSRGDVGEVIADLEKSFAAAEAQATREAMQFEDAASAMTEVKRRCDLYKAGAAASDAYQKERAGAAARLAELEKHPAQAQIAAQLGAVRKLLGDAASIAGLAMRGGVPEQGFKQASARIAQAMTDLEAAGKLADSFGPAMQVRADAGKAKDTASQRKALEELRKQAAALRSAPTAAQASAEFEQFDRAWAAADAAAGEKGEAAAVSASIVAAADALMLARTVVDSGARFEADRAKLAASLEALRKHALAAKIAPRIDAVAKALADAQGQAKSKAYTDATASLRRGEEALRDANGAATRRQTYDTDSGLLAGRIAKVKTKASKEALDKAIAAAAKQADALDFDGATKALDKIEIDLSSVEAKALAAAKPDDPAIAECAKRMMAKGGSKEVDALIQAMDNTKGKAAVLALAEARFNVDFVASGGTDAATLKRICQTFAKVPDHVAKNKSLKSVTHKEPDKNGGAYGTAGSSISLKGRPGQSNQSFGKGIKDEIPPDQVEDACKPADDKAVDYLDFAALHEVGHAVDDANTFMAKRAGNPEFGGWQRHGGDVKPMADAVAAHFAAKRGVAAHESLKQYALDLVQRTPSPAPQPAAGNDPKKWMDAAAAIKKWHEIATTKSPWWNQGLCNDITIGERIYHEAYAQDWVSYLAAARKRGLTGYQFRAPGEWFAELYAAFHSGKLKKEHPSASWLSKLST